MVKVRLNEPLQIGVLADPEHSPLWPRIEALLEPAARRGGVPVLEQYEDVWAVFYRGVLIAAATTRYLPDERIAEVVLVGGRDHKLWLKPLDDKITAWATLGGLKAVRAYGRPGWKRALGWKVIGEKDGFVAYERTL